MKLEWERKVTFQGKGKQALCTIPKPIVESIIGLKKGDSVIFKVDNGKCWIEKK